MPERESHPKRAGDRLDIALTTAASICIAGAVALALWALYPNELDVTTDIVGYPIVHDFNTRQYVVAYALVVGVFPVLAIAVYAGLRRLGGRGRGLPAPAAVEDAADAEPGRPASPLSTGLRVATAGIVWALTAAVASGAGDDWWPAATLAITAGYAAAAVGAGAALARRDGRSWADGVATANAIGAGFLALAVAAFSAGIAVTELDTGNVESFPIAPGWLLVAAGVAAGIAIARRVWRSGDARRAEANVLVYVAGPVALLLLLAFNPGALPSFNIFETGQGVIGGELVGEGWVPWGDVLLLHGPLEDAGLVLVGTSLLDDSVWGDLAGRALIVTPLYWIGLYLLCAYLFRRNLLFLAGTQLVLVLGVLSDLGHQRLIFVPLVLLALAAVLERPTWPRATSLMFASVANVVLVPEAITISAGAWIVIFGRDLAAARGWGPYDEAWRRTVRCAIAGVATSAAIAVVLAVLGALGPFIEFFFTYSRQNELNGGFPIQWEGSDFAFKFWAIAIPVVVLLGWWYGAARIASGRWFTVPELVVGALLIGIAPYYLRFLGRPDEHVFSIASLAVIPLAYMLYRLVAASERVTRARALAAIRHPVTASLVLVVLIVAPTSPFDALRHAPEHVEATAPAAPFNERLGYSGDAEMDRLVPAFEEAADRYAGADGDLFDLTNSPGLVYYLIDREPATRYIESTTAVREPTQEDLVSELEQARPPLVVYSSQSQGLTSWDGTPNAVRNYLVSDWLLDHYRPLPTTVDDYVLMAPRGSAKSDPSLLFETPECEWGYAPNFLDLEPASQAPTASVAAEPAGSSSAVTGSGWAVDPAAGLPANSVVITRGREVVANVATGIPRPDVAAAFDQPGMRDAGFEFGGVLVPGGVSASELGYFGISAAGEASPIAEPPGGSPDNLRMADGETVPVVAGAVEGSVDEVTADELARYRLDVPVDFASFDWLRVNALEQIGDTRFVVTDEGLGGYRKIAWNTTNGNQSTQVRVGSCPQWRGYRDGPLFLHAAPSTGRLEIELVR